MDTSETQVVGHTIINKKAMRVGVYETLDELNQLSNLIMAHMTSSDERNHILDHIKVLKRLINAL